MNATINGTQPRKQLADQIDRLDNILDGLSDAIPQVVADAVRQAVQQAVREGVKAAIDEVLANQELLRIFQKQQQGPAHAAPPSSTDSASPQPSDPPQPAAGSFLSRVAKAAWQGVVWSGRQIGRLATGAVQIVTGTVKTAVACMSWLARPVVWASANTLAGVVLAARNLWGVFSFV